jgi:NifU-like protein involved in Fe-S cluster formation
MGAKTFCIDNLSDYVLASTAKENPKRTTMPADNDLIKLYSARILALAADIPHLDRLDSPDASVKRRSPLCGSTVTVDVNVTDGVITGFGQDVKACALGQASAAVVAGAAIGATREQITTARDQLKAMLKNDGPAPDAPFDGLEVLIPAREFKNRHASILLALEATAEAMEQAAQANCA